MIFAIHRPVRALSAVGAILLAFAPLTGCQGHKVIARVGGEAITEEEYQTRVQRITQLMPNMDAGATALVSMVRERLTEQLSREKKAEPSEEDVRRYAAYFRRTAPQVDADLKAGRTSEDQFLRQIRYVMEDFGIGTEGAKADEADLKQVYTERQKELTIPEMWTLRMLQVPNETVGQQILDQLKTTGDFRAAARQMGVPAQQAVNAGKENTLPVTQLPQALRDALGTLSPGQFTPKPVTVTVANPQAPGGSQAVTLVAQFMKKEPEHVPTLEEVRPVLAQLVIEKKNPSWSQHKDQELAAYTRRTDIQIHIARYQGLKDTVILPAAERFSATSPGGSLAAPSGAPTTGGTTAPPSGTTTSPSGGNPASGGGAGSGGGVTPGAK